MPVMPGGGWLRWEELRRHEVADAAKEGLVVIPLGATEQHGPFLPTGTDIILATTVVERALDIAALGSDKPFVLASFLRIGCSAHHLPFGGTLSLSPRLFLEVLVEVLLSMQGTGVKRMVLVNGHGGNSGICHAAASEAASRSDLTVAVVDYWEFAPDTSARPQPGHAGWFETSLMLAARPDLVAPERTRTDTSDAPQPGRGVYSRNIWAGIEGFTDEPEQATAAFGASLLAEIARMLAVRLVELSEQMP